MEKPWYLNDYFNRYSDLNFDVFEVPDRSFVEFKRTAQKEVNYLVKEFEVRKQQIPMPVHPQVALVC